MDSESLNALHSIPGVLTFTKGAVGFPLALITTPHATATVTPYGAHLLSCRFAADSDELLFLSEKALFQEGTAIRGGVPVCWPWFGPDPKQQGGPDHGLARTRMWDITSSELTRDNECVITFALTDTPETYALWPHRFRLTLKLTVGRELTMELTTENTGETPFELTQALHTYFSIGDIAHTEITGLEGCGYADKTDGNTEKRQSGPIRIDNETDRIYAYEGNKILLHDRARQRTIRITSDGSRSVIVWNPWIRVCEQKADLATDDYRTMVCIETANAGNDIITLSAGESHRLMTVYDVEIHPDAFQVTSK